MEGYNGHVRPLNALVGTRGWRLFNVNNLKLARVLRRSFRPPPRAIGLTPPRPWSCSSSATTCRWPAACSRRSWQRLRRTTSSSACRGAGADCIQAWKNDACFGPNARLVGDMVRQDAKRILELNRQIKALEVEMARITAKSAIARQLASIPGYGSVCTAELAGEIGTIARFRSEASLALYLGMATLDNSSGKVRSSKAPKHVNARAKAATMAAVDHHRKGVPQSQRTYEKKRAEGKRHNQAIRALGRHLCRVIFKMLSQERPLQDRSLTRKSETFSNSLFQIPAGCSKLALSAAPYSRPESGVELKEMARNPTFGLRLPELI